MKSSVLFLALLLSACASFPWPTGAAGSTPGAAREHRKSVPESQPQRPIAVEAKPPVRVEPVDPPKKHQHNIEED